MGEPADPDDIGREPTALVQDDASKARSRAPRNRARPADASYEVVCISMYKTDLEIARARVAELKARGLRRANLSWLIRLALSRLDTETITIGDRP